MNLIRAARLALTTAGRRNDDAATCTPDRPPTDPGDPHECSGCLRIPCDTCPHRPAPAAAVQDPAGLVEASGTDDEPPDSVYQDSSPQPPTTTSSTPQPAPEAASTATAAVTTLTRAKPTPPWPKPCTCPCDPGTYLDCPRWRALEPACHHTPDTAWSQQ